MTCLKEIEECYLLLISILLYVSGLGASKIAVDLRQSEQGINVQGRFFKAMALIS